MSLPSTQPDRPRCGWGDGDDLYRAYHDEEWGVPLHDDQKLFELLMLEGAQAGLSWSTILKKREGYRRAFDNFDPAKVAAYDDAKLAELLQDPGIVRNRLKIQAFRTNARAFLGIQAAEGSFDRYVWSFVGGQPLRRPGLTRHNIPASTPESDALSKDLKKRGFTFVGSTIVYAFMQAAGLVDDHHPGCFKYVER